MKKSITTFLKHPTKDNTNRSANPPVTRASTILFNSMQEMHQHESKIKKHKTTLQQYSEKLIMEGLVPEGEIEDLKINFQKFHLMTLRIMI